MAAEVDHETAVYEEVNLKGDDCITVKRNDCYDEVKKLNTFKNPENKSSSKRIVVALILTFTTLVLLLAAVAASTGYALREISKLKTEIASFDSKIIQMQSSQDQKYSTLEYKVSQEQNSSQAEIFASFAMLQQQSAQNDSTLEYKVSQVQNFSQADIFASFAMLQQQSAQNDSTLGDSIAIIESQIREINNTLSRCGGLGWRRVGYLDMTDPSQSCPAGLALKYYSPGLRSCGRATNDSAGCWSTFYNNTGSVLYSRVRGRIRGYQFGSTDAFASSGVGINRNYVEGISLTHGQSGRRTHIWTFAAALTEVNSSSNLANFKCPCMTSSAPQPPTFVGNDYFCESGVHVRWGGSHPTTFFPNDPLWDGQNCISSCCEFNNPPYFNKNLASPTTDDIELRICSHDPGRFGDTPIDQLELCVQ